MRKIVQHINLITIPAGKPWSGQIIDIGSCKLAANFVDPAKRDRISNFLVFSVSGCFTLKLDDHVPLRHHIMYSCISSDPGSSGPSLVQQR